MMFDRPLVRFLLNSLWPLIAVVLLLSIGLNAFFLLVDRYRGMHETSQTIEQLPLLPTDDSFARGPQAFGIVTRGFASMSQGSLADSTPPVASYTRGDLPLPTLPATMTLYRDQGFETDHLLIDRLFAGLRAPAVSSTDRALFARSLTLRSLDFSLSMTLDAERRVLTVSRTSPTVSTPSPTPADDIEAIALAKQYAQSLGIDADALGSATVREVQDQKVGKKTMVVWYATFGTLPLIDVSMMPMERLSVQVDRSSHQAIMARLSLLEPGALTRSDYPTASAQSIDKALASGGLLPVAKNLKGTPVSAEFSSMDLAYMVIPADHEFPLYIVPVLRAQWSMKPTCKGCVVATFKTFVPVLDDATFQWIRSSTPPSTPSSLSSSGSTK